MKLFLKYENSFNRLNKKVYLFKYDQNIDFLNVDVREKALHMSILIYDWIYREKLQVIYFKSNYFVSKKMTVYFYLCMDKNTYNKFVENILGKNKLLEIVKIKEYQNINKDFILKQYHNIVYTYIEYILIKKGYIKMNNFFLKGNLYKDFFKPKSSDKNNDNNINDNNNNNNNDNNSGNNNDNDIENKEDIVKNNKTRQKYNTNNKNNDKHIFNTGKIIDGTVEIKDILNDYNIRDLYPSVKVQFGYEILNSYIQLVEEYYDKINYCIYLNIELVIVRYTEIEVKNMKEWNSVYLLQKMLIKQYKHYIKFYNKSYLTNIEFVEKFGVKKIEDIDINLMMNYKNFKNKVLIRYPKVIASKTIYIIPFLLHDLNDVCLGAKNNKFSITIDEIEFTKKELENIEDNIKEMSLNADNTIINENNITDSSKPYNLDLINQNLIEKCNNLMSFLNNYNYNNEENNNNNNNNNLKDTNNIDNDIFSDTPKINFTNSNINDCLSFVLSFLYSEEPLIINSTYFIHDITDIFHLHIFFLIYKNNLSDFIILNKFVVNKELAKIYEKFNITFLYMLLKCREKNENYNNKSVNKFRLSSTVKKSPKIKSSLMFSPISVNFSSFSKIANFYQIKKVNVDKKYTGKIEEDINKKYRDEDNKIGYIKINVNNLNDNTNTNMNNIVENEEEISTTDSLNRLSDNKVNEGDFNSTVKKSNNNTKNNDIKENENKKQEDNSLTDINVNDKDENNEIMNDTMNIDDSSDITADITKKKDSKAKFKNKLEKKCVINDIKNKQILKQVCKKHNLFIKEEAENSYYQRLFLNDGIVYNETEINRKGYFGAYIRNKLYI